MGRLPLGHTIWFPAIHHDGIKAYIYETIGFLLTHHENKKGVLWYRLLNKSSF